MLRESLHIATRIRLTAEYTYSSSQYADFHAKSSDAIIFKTKDFY